MEDIKKIIKERNLLKEIDQEIDNHVNELLKRKAIISDEIKAILENKTKPLRNEELQIEEEIRYIMYDLGEDSIKSKYYNVYTKQDLSIKITDIKKALVFIGKNPQVLKSDILKRSVVKEFIKEGDVPTTDDDGIDCSQNYSKLSFRKNNIDV